MSFYCFEFICPTRRVGNVLLWRQALCSSPHFCICQTRHDKDYFFLCTHLSGETRCATLILALRRTRHDSLRCTWCILEHEGHSNELI